MTLDDSTRKFWSAAYFYRRAQDRDQSLAVKVLEQVARSTTGRVYERAITLLEEIDNDSKSPCP